MRNRVFYGYDNPEIIFNFGPQSDAVDWTGFKGFVYAPFDSAIKSSCLLTGESFNLIDNTQIIPIFAYGNRSTQNDELCIWSFIIPSGYKLKFVVTSINLYGMESLNITGSTNSSINSVGFHVIAGDQVEITYNKNHTSLSSSPIDYGFQGYVTLVKPNIPTNNTSQSEHESGTNIIYGNYNHIIGYTNYEVSGFL